MVKEPDEDDEMSRYVRGIIDSIKSMKHQLDVLEHDVYILNRAFNRAERQRRAAEEKLRGVIGL